MECYKMVDGIHWKAYRRHSWRTSTMQHIMESIMDAAESRLARSNANPELSRCIITSAEDPRSTVHSLGHTVSIQLPNTANIRERIVQSVVLFGANTDPGTIIHWRLFCQLSDSLSDEESIELNSQQFDYQLNTRLHIVYRAYRTSERGGSRFQMSYVFMKKVIV